MVVVFVVALSVPLAISTIRIGADAADSSNVASVATDWATRGGWKVTAVTSTSAGIEVDASGGLPAPSASELRRSLDAAGLRHVHVILELTPTQRVDLPPA